LGNYYSQNLLAIICGDCIKKSVGNETQMIEKLLPGSRFQRARDIIANTDFQDEIVSFTLGLFVPKCVQVLFYIAEHADIVKRDQRLF
jgi:hypothetical protein